MIPSLDTIAPVDVVGIGLDGAAGLAEAVRELVDRATLLVGGARQLAAFPAAPGERFVLGEWAAAVAAVRDHLTGGSAGVALQLPAGEGSVAGAIATHREERRVVILVAGDPLFFGLGSYLLENLPAPWLNFHPHISAVQLAFARAKLPWQDAKIVTLQGRSPAQLVGALEAACEKIAVLTVGESLPEAKGANHPTAIVALVLALRLPSRYRIWVGENLGDAAAERVRAWIIEPALLGQFLAESFAPLNVVILERLPPREAVEAAALPVFGLEDSLFYPLEESSGPGLQPQLTLPRETRVQVLAELALAAGQVVWDVGAGVGAVAVEVARLCPGSTVYAIEQTAAGIAAIERNAVRFATGNLVSLRGRAPAALRHLAAPDRVFVGGSDGCLAAILDTCASKLNENGLMVLALATVENQAEAIAWATRRAGWVYRLVRLSVERSLPVGVRTRWLPLPPVALGVLWRSPSLPLGSDRL